jgi:hypothetical protein
MTPRKEPGHRPEEDQQLLAVSAMYSSDCSHGELCGCPEIQPLHAGGPRAVQQQTAEVQ